MLNIMLGDFILYVITLDVKRKQFKMFHRLRLGDMNGILLTDEMLNGIQQRYKEHIDNLDTEDLIIEKEKLCYHIQSEEKRIDTSIDKLNIYATIVLTVLPLVLAVIDLKKIVYLSMPLFLGVFFIVYVLLNICIYIFRVIKVRGMMKSSFSDLRLSEQKDKEILLQYQYDWQQLKCKAQLFVSFLLNLQEWVISLLVLMICFSVGVSLDGTNKQIMLDGENLDTVITVEIEEVNEPYSDSAIGWQSLILEIEEERYKEIVFIVNEQQDTSFVGALNKYSDLDVKILKDEMLEIGQVKIIRGE